MRLFTRRGYDWTTRHPLICEAVATISRRSVILDGEAVYCDDAGVSVFEKRHSGVCDHPVVLYTLHNFRLWTRLCREGWPAFSAAIGG